MKTLLLHLMTCAALTVGTASKADYSYYYVTYEFNENKARVCDRDVREYSNYYKNDMANLIKAYKKKDDIKLREILAKYGMTQESDAFLKNNFVSAVLSCSSVYAFNKDVNYWREFMKEMSLLMLQVHTTLNITGKYNGEIYETYEDAMYSLNTILQSDNKLLTNRSTPDPLR